MVDAAGLIPEFGLGDELGHVEDHKEFPMPPIHVRYQQRTGRKGFTLIEGIPDDIDMKKLLKAFKKKFACNGTIVDNPEKGLIIQLQGENRQNVKIFLIYEGIGTEDTVKVHGH